MSPKMMPAKNTQVTPSEMLLTLSCPSARPMPLIRDNRIMAWRYPGTVNMSVNQCMSIEEIAGDSSADDYQYRA